jgi:hypothetical protein
MYLAERIVLTKGIQKEEYELADRSAPLAKLLYNAALFRVRQTFTGWDKEIRTENEKEVFDELALLKKAYPKLNVRRVISYNALEKLMRVTDNPDFFAGLPMQTAQAVIKAAVQDFRNWLASLKEYRKDPSKFFEKPQMPHYCTVKYEDHFVSTNRLIAISKSNRTIQSEDVQNFLHARERGISVELFVRKNKDDKISKEFYYLGHMTASGRTKEFIMPNTTSSAVEIEWILDTPVRNDLYEYIVSR